MCSIWRVSREDAASWNSMTHCGSALSKLNYEILCDNTSRDKGRVERAHHTLQDRLVKELRLAGISTIEAANAFLPTSSPTTTAALASLRPAIRTFIVRSIPRRVSIRFYVCGSSVTCRTNWVWTTGA